MRTHQNPRWHAARAATAALIAASLVVSVAGEASGRQHPLERRFQRVATFAAYENVVESGGSISEQTVAEIVDVTDDGMTLVSTDSPGQRIAFTDISVPSTPAPLGVFDVGGEPTSVSITGSYALVGVNTSASFVDPSGVLLVVDVSDPASPAVAASLDLGGQPDSVKVSPDGRYAAVVIENERDEDLGDGAPPQLPSGFLTIVDLVGAPPDWTTRVVDLAGVADQFPEDAEPEFVDINDANLAVVTLQENNHLVVVDLPTGTIVRDFSAGSVDLVGVDNAEDGVISLTDTILDVPREPDAVAWIGGNRFATANEGDLFGGSRGFSVFDTNGGVRFDAGASFEELAVRHGHYPEDRSENKGSEPEAIEYGQYGPQKLLFVASERGSFVAVYRITGSNAPELMQVLPAGLGPEGLLAIPERNLFIASSEEDDPDFGVRATISIYELGIGQGTYPDIVSANDASGSPIPWSALSGLTSDPADPDVLYGVWDSYYSESVRFTIDISTTPAVITVATTYAAENLDPEGIAIASDGTTWIASEGNATDTRPNQLVHLDADLAVTDRVALPQEIVACRASTTRRGTLGSGFEGVTTVPGADGDLLVVAQQRGWDYTTPECEDLDDDPTGTNLGEPGWTRLWVYDPATGEWDAIPYELDPKPVNASWIGLSEVTLVGDHLVLIERDNRTGAFTETKNLVRVSLDDVFDGDGITRDEKQRADLIGPLRSTNGWITDKPEGFAVTAAGDAYVVTDNDGVEDWSGESQLLPLGSVDALFD